MNNFEATIITIVVCIGLLNFAAMMYESRKHWRESDKHWKEHGDQWCEFAGLWKALGKKEDKYE